MEHAGELKRTAKPQEPACRGRARDDGRAAPLRPRGAIAVRPLPLLAFLLAVALSIACSCAPAAQDAGGGFEEATVSRVVDGDTVAVSIGGQERKVRLVNIDCPESVNPDRSKNSPEGSEAARFTSSLLPAGRTVWLQREVSDTDRYGRLLRHVWLEKPGDPLAQDEVAAKMLDAIIVANGHAKVVDYPPDTRYSQILRGLSR